MLDILLNRVPHLPPMDRLVVNITGCLKMKFPFQGATLKVGMNPAGILIHMLWTDITALHLDGTSSQNNIWYPVSLSEPSLFHHFCTTEVLNVDVGFVFLVKVYSEIIVSVYVSVFQTERETEKEAEDFTL